MEDHNRADVASCIIDQVEKWCVKRFWRPYWSDICDSGKTPILETRDTDLSGCSLVAPILMIKFLKRMCLVAPILMIIFLRCILQNFPTSCVGGAMRLFPKFLSEMSQRTLSQDGGY